MSASSNAAYSSAGARGVMQIIPDITDTGSVVLTTLHSTRTDQGLPSHTSGTDPGRIVPTTAKSKLPAVTWASPAACRGFRLEPRI
jgi:hypothetical protein